MLAEENPCFSSAIYLPISNPYYMETPSQETDTNSWSLCCLAGSAAAKKLR